MNSMEELLELAVEGEVAAQARARELEAENVKLRRCLRAALEWIDAVPSDVVDQFPTMPGFERNDAESLLCTPTKDGPK